MNKIATCVLAIVLGSAYAAVPMQALAQASAEAAAPLSEGEIKKVDKDAKKLTIKHGELKNLGMPAMTMVFKVKDPAMVDQVKQGDKVRFVAEQANGALTVTAMEIAK